MLGLGRERDRGSLAEAADEAAERLRSALPDDLERRLSSCASSTEPLTQQILRSPIAIVVTTLGATAASFSVYRRYFRRIPTTAYITPSTMRWRSTIVGRCLSVGDADGFRLFHTPGPPLYRHLRYGNVSETGKGHGNGHGGGSLAQKETISVRLAGADAPESSHFGKPAQPFSKEAKEELEKLVLGREVWCQMAHIDQYQRLVATPYVWLPPYIFGRTNVSLHLVKRGLATVYTQAGAAYGTAGPGARLLRWILGLNKSTNANETTAKTAVMDRLIPLSGEARLRRAMSRAKRRKLGVWSLKNFETPEEYKRKMRQNS